MKPLTDVRIFIADDDPDDLLLIQEALEESGRPVHLTSFEAGEALLDGLRIAARNHTLPNLVLVDLNMPGTNGRDVIVEVKKDETLRHIPILVLTTSSDQQDIVDCYELGASSYIVKPAKYGDLLALTQAVKDYWTQTTELPGPAKYHD